MALRLARNVTLANIVQLQQLPVALVLRVLLQIEGLVLVVQVVVHAMPDNGLRTSKCLRVTHVEEYLCNCRDHITVCSTISTVLIVSRRL